MNGIGIVLCYFGAWPKWAHLFWESCRWNPGFDWLVFTDCGIPVIEANNVRFHSMSLGEFSALMSRKLRLDIRVTRPYKVCDFRPAYGVVFEDHLKDYRFWGYCDLDLIFGNIGRFLTEEVLANHDVISARKDFLSGHFALYRNNQIVNRLFLSSRDYPEVFLDQTMRGLDEAPLRVSYDAEGRVVFDTTEYKGSTDGMTSILKRKAAAGVVRPFFGDLMDADVEPARPRSYVWQKGALRGEHTRHEIMYFHFIRGKSLAYFSYRLPSLSDMRAGLVIGKDGINAITGAPLAKRLVVLASKCSILFKDGCGILARNVIRRIQSKRALAKER